MTKPTLSILDEKVNSHEKLCLEKYENIKSRLLRIEIILMSSTASIIGLLLNLSF
jgi:hypothetical protein|tara:strand:+ start:313 stop:477 length:165 start_codon:yes stop_codon:yes gene_type:complete